MSKREAVVDVVSITHAPANVLFGLEGGCGRTRRITQRTGEGAPAIPSIHWHPALVNRARLKPPSADQKKRDQAVDLPPKCREKGRSRQLQQQAGQQAPTSRKICRMFSYYWQKRYNNPRRAARYAATKLTDPLECNPAKKH